MPKPKPRSSRTAALATVLVALALAPVAQGQKTPAAAPAAAAGAAPAPKGKRADSCRPIRGSFVNTLKQEAELKDFVEWIQVITCKRFIFPVNLAGRSTKITIYSTAAINADDAWKLFLSSMETMQLNVVPSAGGFYKIVESMRVKDEMPPIFRTPSGVPNSDQIVTALFRTEHVSPDDVANLLAGLKSREGIITTYAPANLLIVTDYGTSIRRLARIVKEVDIPSGNERVFVYRLHKASAADVTSKLNEVFGQQGGNRGQVVPPRRFRGQANEMAPPPGGTEIEAGDVTASKIVADDRTNSIIVIASDKSWIRIRALIEWLDRNLENGTDGGRIHVYGLENADAEPLANILNQISGGQGGGGLRTRGGGGGQSGAAETGFEGSVKISPDKSTNSLIIVSSQGDFLQLRDVIRRLDLPRRQVFVEATILEVSVDKDRQVGFAFHGAGSESISGHKGLTFGGVESASLNSLLLNPLTLTGLAAGIRGENVTGGGDLLGIPGASIPSFGAVFQALQNNTDVNVLSTPHILTTDNEKAEILVGENVPFASSLIPPAAAAGAASLFSGIVPQIQRQDVALKLDITPHVNQSGFVRLEFEQEVSDIKVANFNGTGQPSTNKRTVKTTVVVRDQESVVIGGLMTDKEKISETKVPILGDLPILGFFFRQKQRTLSKANLLIFLTPYVINSQDDLRKIFERKLQERREFIQAYTSFQDRDFEAHIDYRKKRGLIEEINKAVLDSAEEDRQIEAAKEAAKTHEDAGPIRLPAGYEKGGTDDPDDGPGDDATPDQTTPPPAGTPAPTSKPKKGTK